MKNIHETIAYYRGLDPVITVPRWERLIEKRVKKATTPNPRYINQPERDSSDGRYITIDNREADSGLTVVFYTTTRGALVTSSAVVLEQDKPVRLAFQEPIGEMAWHFAEDGQNTRLVVKANYLALRGASPFTSNRGKWHGSYPDLKGIKNLVAST